MSASVKSTTVFVGEGAFALGCLDALVACGLRPALVASFDASLADACARLGLAHAGEREDVRAWLFSHGVSWHELTLGSDDGRLQVQVQVPVPIAAFDTAFSLNIKCFEVGVAAFERVLDVIAGGPITLALQVGTGSDFATERPSAQCIIDWQRPAQAIVDLVRALDFGPAPNPLGLRKLWLGGRRLGIGKAIDTAMPSTSGPGTLLAYEADSLRVATSTTSRLITRSPMAGRLACC